MPTQILGVDGSDCLKRILEGTERGTVILVRHIDIVVVPIEDGHHLVAGSCMERCEWLVSVL
jgi:hypothetical protein